jgi:Ca2+-binding EF-hand superfamily protein
MSYCRIPGLKEKLEYAFSNIDCNGDGFLDKTEIKRMVINVLQSLSIDRKFHDVDELVNSCMLMMDENNDGKVNKGKIYMKRYKIFKFFMLF